MLDDYQIRKELSDAAPLHHSQLGRFQRLVEDLLDRVHKHFKEHAPEAERDPTPG